jgi:putative membrane-bound dehydrogenase-like protein
MIRCVSFPVIAFSLVTISLAAEPASLQEQLPRIPPQSPQQALSTFTLQRGFSLELVAAEPDVVDPIDAAFDEDGRMYVVEMRDYPFLPEQRAAKYVERQPENWGAIRLLEDTNGDGRMDKSTVFADQLRWPQSVCCYRGGVFVIAPPTLWYFKDTAGDGVADVKEEWFTGFGLSNVQALANGLEWSLDHGIYWAGGRTGAEITRGTEKLFTLNRQDLRLNPMTRELTPVSGGEQYGHTFDDWGNRFVCNNSNHLEQVVVPLRYIDRNPQLAVSNVVRTIAKEGAAAPVYRLSPAEPWRIVRTARRAADPAFAQRAPATELVATGFFTSATGVTVYRGGAYPPEFHGNVFIGDVGGNLVHRKQLTPNGITQLGVRTEEQVEFLASTDNWFRPANFVNAPDGTLYVLDMYWETIEHPASIPEDIKEHLDLESGNDRGRIYRLVSPNMSRSRPPKMSGMSTVELVGQLASPHGWVRDTAHRLIWERQDGVAEAPLRELVKAAAKPQARLHALWSLEGIGKLTVDDVLLGMSDADPRVREHAVRLSERFADSPSPKLLAKLGQLADDPDLRVCWQLGFTLGEFTTADVHSLLLRLVKRFPQDADIRVAVLSSVSKTAGPFAVALLADVDLAGSPLSRELLRQQGARSDADAAMVFAAILSPTDPKFPRPVLLEALGEGLRRRGSSLSKVTAALPESDRAIWDRWLEQQVQTAADPKAAVPARTAAVRLLGSVPTAAVQDALAVLLEPQAPPAVQQQAVQSLLAGGDAASAGRVLAKWKGLGPQSRKEAVAALVQSRAGAAALLAGVAEGTVKPAELERDKQQQLLSFPQPAVRDQAKALLGGANSNRREIVAQYQSALTLDADAARGHAVYKKICFQCHRAGTEGHAVGPDLASVQNKSPDDLLIAILDPNREAQPIFTSYTAATLQGQVFTGIIAAETAASLTLRRAEAKEDTVQRDQLDELISNGVSLMPEGVEKDLSPQQLADVIAFIKAQSPPPTGGR